MAVKRKASPRGDARLSVRTPKKRGGVGGGGARNPNSLANLRPPWQPGQPSPNPGGRPKALGEAYRRWLEHIDPQTGLTNAEMIADAMGCLALRGDVPAAREIRTATEGDLIRFQNMSDEELVRFITSRLGIASISDSSGGEAQDRCNTATP